MPNLTRYLRGWGRRKPGPGARIDWVHPLTRGLVFCVLTNEGAGDVHDLTYKGTIDQRTGSITTSDWSLDSYLSGPCLSVNGASDYFRITPAAVTAYPCTLLAWTQALAGNNGSFRDVIDCENPANSAGFYVGWSSTNGTAAIDVFDGSNSFIATGAVLGIGVWACLVGVFNTASDRRLYVNGVLSASDTRTTGALTSIVKTFFGAPFGTSFVAVSTALIWNRALSAAEIAWLYQEPFAFIQQPAPKRFFIPAPSAPPATGLFEPARVFGTRILGRGMY